MMGGRGRFLTRMLVMVWLALFLVAVFFGVPGRYTHHAIWAPGRVLFIPVGVGGLLFAWLVWRGQRRGMAAWMALGSVALIGIGAHRAWPGPWTLLAVPATAAGAVRTARACVLGARDRWTMRMAESLRTRGKHAARPVRWARIYLGGTAVLCATGVVMAITAA